MRHRIALVLATAVATFTLLASGGPAGAHEGDAIIQVQATHPAGSSVHFIVMVTWENDGHPAVDATVTATALSIAGEQLTPVALAPEGGEGVYGGAVEFPSPGVWTVRFTSIDPDGTLEQIEEVNVAPSTVPTTAPAEGDSDVTVGTEADPGFAPEDDGTGPSAAEDEQAAAADDGGDDGLPVWLIGLAAVVVVGGAIAAVRTIRRSRPDAGEGPRTNGDTPAEPSGGTDPSADHEREPTGPTGGAGP
jgi:hypothetical protein